MQSRGEQSRLSRAEESRVLLQSVGAIEAAAQGLLLLLLCSAAN